jgi:RNA polymerase sigma factor (sigma-70 family)
MPPSVYKDETRRSARETPITVYAPTVEERRVKWPLESTALTPELLFQRHYRSLVGALAVASGNRELATDAVQDAFLELCKRWDRISRYEKAEAWLRRVAVNKLRSEQRSIRRRAATLLRLREQHDEPVPAAPWAVAEAFRSLPARQRLACSLFYILDLSLEEVAEAMGVSPGAVASHLHRARTTLRPLLEEE